LLLLGPHAPLLRLSYTLQHLVDERVYVICGLSPRSMRCPRERAGQIELVHAFKIGEQLETVTLHVGYSSFISDGAAAT
jgi:hypothetical protein